MTMRADSMAHSSGTFLFSIDIPSDCACGLDVEIVHWHVWASPDVGPDTAWLSVGFSMGIHGSSDV